MTRASMSQPRPNPLHRLMHLGRRAGVAEADEVPAFDRIKIDAGRRGDMRLLQHTPREVEAVVGEARHIGIEIEGAVDRKKLVETDLGQALDENAPVLLVA